MKFRYVTGLHRDAQERVSLIPPPQMARFLEAHQEWLASERRAHASGQPNKGKKKKWQPLDALKEMFDPVTGEIFEQKVA